MSYATLRDGIEAALNTIPNRGVVHDYWRHAPNRSDFINLYQVTIGGVAQVRAWLIQLTNIIPDEESAFGEQGMAYRFEVYFYRSLNDDAATEHGFVTLLETGMRTLMQKRSFGAAGARIYSTEVTGVTIDHAMFGDVLCHRGRIGLDIVIDFAQSWS